ncbi:MAG: putative metal-binding motif-containing protein [Sandaracinus sp.]|nr:putative metal-binding motif-containing protein [Sandaracinus sp.]
MRLASLMLVLLVACGDDDIRTGDGGLPDVGFSDGGLDAGPIDVECVDPGSTVGASCETAADCSDGCVCNGIERCEAGVCVAGEDPCDDGIECTTDGCDEDADVCVYGTDDSLCADDDLCNGAERCVVGLGCRAGSRLSCSDGDPCTVGSCDPVEGCSFELRDLDGDGFADDRCGGLDCFDDPEIGSNVYPGAPEVCGNGIDDNCNGIFDYREVSCTASNDDCATAEVLPGPGTYVRSTRGLSNAMTVGCRSAGLDAVFTFTLDRARDVVLVAEIDGGNGAVALRPIAECDSTGPDALCANEGPVSSLTARDLAPGEYAVVVETSTATSFALSLSFLDPTPILPVDLCDDDTVDVSAGGTFMGLFEDVNDDYELSCRTPSTTQVRKDVAYRLEITSPKDVVLRATTRTSSSVRPSTYLTLVRDCGNPATSLACVQSQSSEIRRRALEPGVYFVLLESSSTSALSWELQVNVVDAMPRNEGDACSTAEGITDTLVTLPLTSLELDYGTGCGGGTASSRDASYAFTLTERRDVILESNVGAIHYLSVATECGNPATELLCTSGTPALSPRLLRMDPGTYYVTLSTTLSSGDVSITARTEPPTETPVNDVCDGAIALANGVEARGSLLGASDTALLCGADGSRDAFYRLELTERQNVTLVARRTDGSTEPLSLSLFGGSCAAPDVPRCASGTPALLNRTLDAGTHYVAVESIPSFAGSYVLTAYLAAP